MSKDALGWKCKFAVVAPSTNTIVQPDMDSLRIKGVTNHYGRIHIPNMKVGNDKEFVELVESIEFIDLVGLAEVLKLIEFIELVELILLIQRNQLM